MTKAAATPVSQAIVFIDHHAAEIQLLSEGRNISLKEHRHQTRQHGSSVRSEHAFFSDVCDALMAVSESLVLGSHMAQADFRHYVEKHRPALAPHLVGWETVDHLTAAEGIAHGRAFFEKFDRMKGRAHAH